jgi:hypothetical protein
LFTTGVQQRRKFNIDVLLAFGCVVQVQHPFPLTGSRVRASGQIRPLVMGHRKWCDTS